MIKKLGRYEILGVLGRGSMGVVYKGVDPQIGKLVAIKTMNPKTIRQKDMQERFYREGNLLGQLKHKNLITVYNVGTDGDHCFIAMEYLDGVSLERILEVENRMPLERVFRIVLQVCDGVHAAHKKTITHRDLKPANIFVLDGDLVKILDFGVARLQDSDLTNSGMLLGTINYIAPEQITGLTIDHRADIFSLGVILYELVAGVNPFLGRNVSKTMVKIINENPPVPEHIPTGLGEILMNMLQKDREQRYGSMVEVASDLERLMRSEPEMLSRPRVPSEGDLQQKKAEEWLGVVRQHLRREELDEAEALLDRVARLRADHPDLAEMQDRLAAARRRLVEKKSFAEKFNQEAIDKATAFMIDRHFIQAIEYCDKVLAVQADHEQARNIRATCILKLERFLEQLRGGSR